MKRKIIGIFCLLLMVTMIITPVFAKGPSYEALDPGGDGGAGGGGGNNVDPDAERGNMSNFLNEIIGQGNSFIGSSTSMGTEMKKFINDNIVPTINVIGNLIFAAVTVILGAKYIWSSAEGKSQVMESLPTFVAAVVFFYLGGTLVNWLTSASSGIVNASSWSTVEARIIGTINMVVKYMAFGGLLYLGLRYMFASAEGKSQIKTNMGGLVLGIIFVFLASNAVDFIIDIAEGVL